MAGDEPAGARAARGRIATGVGFGWSDGDFGRGPTYRFHDPDGHLMAVYYDEQKYRAPDHLRSTLRNLPMKYAGRGVNVRCIDHLALFAKDVAANRMFAQERLGFRLREQVLTTGLPDAREAMAPASVPS